jgi:hypothetical protein
MPRARRAPEQGTTPSALQESGAMYHGLLHCLGCNAVVIEEVWVGAKHGVPGHRRRLPAPVSPVFGIAHVCPPSAM